MRKLLFIPICLAALVIPVVVLANGGGDSFDGLIQTIETKYHVHATRIPMMGLVSLIARRAEGNVRDLHVAEVENFTEPVDQDELNQIVQQKLGYEWQPVIRETHRKPHVQPDEAKQEQAATAKQSIDSQTLVFMRPEGERMGLFVFDHDGQELDIVQLSVDAQHLREKVAHYTHHGPRAGADDSK